MRRISNAIGRPFPREPRIPPKDGEDRGVVLERILEEHQRNTRELDESIFGDVRDRVVIRSKGPNKEIKVPHRMPVKPTDFQVVNQTGAGSVWQARSSLADSEFGYFKTSALAGVKFRIVFGVIQPLNGVGEEEFQIEPPPADEVEDEKVKPGGKGDKKPGKGSGTKD